MKHCCSEPLIVLSIELSAVQLSLAISTVTDKWTDRRWQMHKLIYKCLIRHRIRPVLIPRRAGIL